MAKMKAAKQEDEKVPADIKDSTFLSGMHHLYGTCRFCQQTRMMTYGTDNIPQEQIDKDATLSCTCPESQDYRRIQEAAGKAKDNLRGLNRDFKTDFPEVLMAECDKLIDLIASGTLLNVNIKTNQRSIILKKKGESKISVKYKKQSEAEIEA